MSATSIYFNGRLTRVPGSYSEIDASALDAVALGATGYVAILGMPLGGKPYSAIDLNDVPGTIQKSTKPGQARTFFRPGSDLLDAESLAFNPSNDPDIKGGAQRVYWIKVNPAIQSSHTLTNPAGDALTLTSLDYGFATTLINVQVGLGTSGSGKLYTITFEDVIEVFDNVGEDAYFSVQYAASTPAQGFTTITAEATAAKWETDFTRTQAGLESDISNPVNVVGYAAAAKIEIVSDDVGDTMNVTLIGVDAAGTAIREVLALNGTTAVPSVNDFNDFHGGVIASAPTGTVTVRNLSGGTTICTLTGGALSKGLGICTDMVVAGQVVSVVVGAAYTRRATLVGLSHTGAIQAETVTLTGVASLNTTLKWNRLDYIAVGDVEAARTLTIGGVSITAPYASIDTLKKLADKVGTSAGYTFTTISGQLGFLLSNLDTVTSTDIKAAALSFWATLYDAVTVITAGSGLVVATRASGGSGAPTNTTDPLFLSGGHEGSATPGLEGTPTAVNADWIAAFDVLKKLFVNTVVPLSSTIAVHTVAKDHEVYMNGAGRKERDVIVGIKNAGLTAVATKTEIKSQAITLNSRNIRMCAQTVDRYNAAGVLTTFDPPYQAVIAAGAQAGSEVGTSLTHKVANIIAVGGDTTWHPEDDANEMIGLGLLFCEVVDGIGIRWVRNVTTHLTTSNIAYTDANVNEAVNYIAYNFRTNMEAVIGKKGFAGTVQAAQGIAVGTLDAIISAGAMTTWRSLDMELLVDVFEVSVECAPIISINFVKNTIHLIAVPQSA